MIVGRAVRTDPLLLTGTFDPGAGAPLLLADGVGRVSRLASLDGFQRSYGWVTPVDLDRVRALGVNGYLALSARADDELGASTAGALVLTAPDDVLRAQDVRARDSARRFALLGGAATALLLCFGVIAAVGLRRDHAAVAELLRRRGTPRRALLMLTAAESAAPVAAGTAVGLLAGCALAAWRAAAAGLPALASGVTAVQGAWSAVLPGSVLAAAVVAATVAWPAATAPGAAWRVVDLTVLAGLAAAALALARGTVSAGALGERGDPLLFALPVICVVCGGLLVGRAWPVLAALAARAVPRHWLGLRIGLLGGLRRPLRPVANVAFLAAATGVVVFAGAYQSTLHQGAADQAAFAVPLDATIGTGTDLKRPLDVASPAGFAATVPGVTVHPVLRAAAGVRANAAQSLTAEVVGVDPAALTRIRYWDRVVGGHSPARAAALISPATSPAAARQAGMPVPAGAGALSFPVSGDTAQVTVTVWLRSADGRDTGLALLLRSGRLVAQLPAGLRAPTRLFALTMAESQDYATYHQHKIGESDTDVELLTGSLTLGAPQFTGTAVSGAATAWSGWGSTLARVTAADGRLSIGYRFTGARVVVRANAGAASAPIPVLTDPVTAAAAVDGVLHLVVNGNDPIRARVVGVTPRFPTAGTRFVVADVDVFAAALDAREPGTGSVSELWLRAPDGQARALDRALSAAPYDQLRVDTWQARQDELTGDPVARAASGLLTSSALAALLVAVLGMVMLVVAERRDESAELYAWESDGVAPRTLRVSLLVRAGAVVAVGVPGGLLVGLVLSLLATRLVAVTAGATAAMPPLALSVGPAWVAAVLVIGVLTGMAACGAVAAAALREPMPRRPEEHLW